MSVSITQNLSSAWCLWAEHCSVVAGWAWGIMGQQFLLWPSLAPQHLYSETQSDPLRLLPRLSKSHYSIFVLLHTTNFSHDLQVSCLLRYTLSQVLATPGHWHSREAAGTLHSCLYFLPSLPVSFLQTSHVSPVQREGLDPMAMLLVIKLLLWFEDGSNWAVSFTREIYHFLVSPQTVFRNWNPICYHLLLLSIF